MTEETNDPRKLPTYDNIVEAMRWLVHGARPNDSLFLHCIFLFFFFLKMLILMIVRFWAWRTNSRFGRRRGRWLGWRQVSLVCSGCNHYLNWDAVFSHFPFGLQAEGAHCWRCKFFACRDYSFLSHGFSRLTVNAWHYGNLYSIYGFFFNYRVWFCFQVKPLPRGCRLTVRSLKLSFHPSVLILMIGTLRCNLICSVIFIQLILSLIFKACHSGSVLGMFVIGIDSRFILIFFGFHLDLPFDVRPPLRGSYIIFIHLIDLESYSILLMVAWKVAQSPLELKLASPVPPMWYVFWLTLLARNR